MENEKNQQKRGIHKGGYLSVASLEKLLGKGSGLKSKKAAAAAKQKRGEIKFGELDNRLYSLPANNAWDQPYDDTLTTGKNCGSTDACGKMEPATFKNGNRGVEDADKNVIAASSTNSIQPAYGISSNRDTDDEITLAVPVKRPAEKAKVVDGVTLTTIDLSQYVVPVVRAQPEGDTHVDCFKREKTPDVCDREVITPHPRHFGRENAPKHWTQQLTSRPESERSKKVMMNKRDTERSMVDERSSALLTSNGFVCPNIHVGDHSVAQPSGKLSARYIPKKKSGRVGATLTPKLL
jgi:hypothetical protein